jgi:membrane fusion protein, adhesin transport system
MSAGDWELREFAAGAEAARLRFATRTLTLVLTLALALFAAGAWWASQATIEEFARADGRVIPSGKAQVVQSLEGGIVKEIMVREGDAIAAGEVLLRIDDTSATASRGELLARRRVLLLRAARLEAEATAAEGPSFPDDIAREIPDAAARELTLFESRRATLASQETILEAQRLQKEQQVAELQASATRVVESIRLLTEEIRLQTDSGVIPRARIIPLERQLNEKERELGELRGAAQQARSAEREAGARLSEVRLAFSEEARGGLAEALGELSVLEESLRRADDVVVRSELRAPVAGIVTSLAVNTIGGVIAPGSEVLQILPSEEALQVEARVRPEDIAFVLPGLPATVKLTAFDFTVYGALDGEVVQVGADSLVDERSGAAYFPIIVQTNSNALAHRGETLDIKPGMVASVDVQTGERSVLDYLLKPFRKARYEALRER